MGRLAEEVWGGADHYIEVAAAERGNDFENQRFEGFKQLTWIFMGS